MQLKKVEQVLNTDYLPLFTEQDGECKHQSECFVYSNTLSRPCHCLAVSMNCNNGTALITVIANNEKH